MADETDDVGPRNPVEQCIMEVCDETANMLVRKNRRYGNSALNPVRVFSHADPREQLLVRIDDKLSRIANGDASIDDGEDTLSDLIGYLVLLVVFNRVDDESDEDDDESDDDESDDDDDDDGDDPEESAQDLADDFVAVSAALATPHAIGALTPKTALGRGVFDDVARLLSGARDTEQRLRETASRMRDLDDQLSQANRDPRVATLALREVFEACRKRLPPTGDGHINIGRSDHEEAKWHPIIRGIQNIARRGLSGDDPVFLARAAVPDLVPAPPPPVAAAPPEPPQPRHGATPRGWTFEEATAAHEAVMRQRENAERERLRTVEAARDEARTLLNISDATKERAYKEIERLERELHEYKECDRTRAQVHAAVAPVPTFQAQLEAAVVRQAGRLLRRREQYLKAWMARYGCDVRECVLIEQADPAGGFRLHLEHRSDARAAYIKRLEAELDNLRGEMTPRAIGNLGHLEDVAEGIGRALDIAKEVL